MLASCTVSFETRTVYILTNRQMELARYYAENGYWIEAAEIWSEVAESDKSKYLRRRSAFNMVVACEILERRDLAKEWAEEI
ncbi:MAG: hypothetical protein IH948_05750, partial [Bacteroidetes bacterium]|nr:hypothetical protein [Bacteroidota bacterium]